CSSCPLLGAAHDLVDTKRTGSRSHRSESAVVEWTDGQGSRIRACAADAAAIDLADVPRHPRAQLLLDAHAVSGTGRSDHDSVYGVQAAGRTGKCRSDL